ncbi:hypothetical protein ALO99_200193 [Pseudomonas coronafaciens pv. porri]|nr:hypothetical protein ALO99_200193 [Pseudomonas coronafaciens pv. porri]
MLTVNYLRDVAQALIEPSIGSVGSSPLFEWLRS